MIALLIARRFFNHLQHLPHAAHTEFLPGDQLSDVCRIGISSHRNDEEIYIDADGELEIPSSGSYEVHWRRLVPTQSISSSFLSPHSEFSPTTPAAHPPQRSSPFPLSAHQQMTLSLSSTYHQQPDSTNPSQ